MEIYREFKNATIELKNKKTVKRQVRRIDNEYFATVNRDLIMVKPNSYGIFVEIDFNRADQQ